MNRIDDKLNATLARLDRRMVVIQWQLHILTAGVLVLLAGVVALLGEAFKR
jgi:hypothetical protein